MRKRKYSPEFRERAVKQTLTGDESIKDIAAGLGISYWTLQDWRREYLESQKNEPETRKKSSAEEELKRLRAENASLRMDNTKVCSHAFPGRLKKFAFMKAWRKDFSVNRMAAMLGVSKSGFYSYMKRSGKKKEVVSSDLLSMITQIHRSNRRCFGLRKICHELKVQGLQYSRLSVIRGMKMLEISGKRRKRYAPRTTDSDHDSPVSPNLLNRISRRNRQIRHGYRTSRM